LVERDRWWIALAVHYRGMSPYEPFVGVLLLPGRVPFGSTSAVTLADGQPVAQIRWRPWSMSARFEILDAMGGAELAAGGKSNAWGRSYAVTGPGGGVLLDLKLSGWSGPNGRSTVTLPGGQALTTKGKWTGRKFEVLDGDGATVARLATTSGVFSMRQDSLAFEMTTPVLSIVQAIGLAQCMRAAVEASRAASSS
jgi:hypothetical protein